MKTRGICKECGAEFFIETENYGTDESLCEYCITEKENAEFRQSGPTRYEPPSRGQAGERME